jgi:hypothetical protein
MEEGNHRLIDTIMDIIMVIIIITIVGIIMVG